MPLEQFMISAFISRLQSLVIGSLPVRLRFWLAHWMPVRVLGLTANLIKHLGFNLINAVQQ